MGKVNKDIYKLNFDYTIEMYEEDRKLAIFTIKKYFRYILSDKDLFYSVLAYLLSKAPLIRSKFDITLGKYSNLAVTSFYNFSCKFFRFGYGRTYFQQKENLSLDYSMLDDKRTLEDVLDNANELANIESNANMIDLNKYIKQARENCFKSKKGKPLKILHAQEILDLYLSGKSLECIGKHFNLTRERVRQIVKLFQDKLKNLLIQTGYLSQSYFNGRRKIRSSEK